MGIMKGHSFLIVLMKYNSDLNVRQRQERVLM